MTNPFHAWFSLPAIRDWRNLVHEKRRQRAIESARTQEPAQQQRRGSRAPNRKYLIQVGRSGVRVPPPLKNGAQRSRRTILDERLSLSDALDRLLLTAPLNQITIVDLLKEANKPRATFYDAFASGMPGVHCFWATRQIELLTARIDETLSLQSRARPERVLTDWADCVSRFIAERPLGRLSVFPLITYELDQTGSDIIARLNDTIESLTKRRFPPLERRKRKKKRAQLALIRDEYAELAADLCDAEARLVNTLVPFFEGVIDPDHLVAAKRAWSVDGTHSILWNLSLSLWHSVLASMCAVGLPEAEVGDKHTAFLLHVWSRGVFKE